MFKAIKVRCIHIISRMIVCKYFFFTYFVWWWKIADVFREHPHSNDIFGSLIIGTESLQANIINCSYHSSRWPYISTESIGVFQNQVCPSLGPRSIAHLRYLIGIDHVLMWRYDRTTALLEYYLTINYRTKIQWMILNYVEELCTRWGAISFGILR